MAIPTKDVQTDVPTKAAPFSYAQAAKGKSSAVTKPLVSVDQEKESISWADDIETVIDETHQNGSSNVNGTSETSESSGKTLSTRSLADTLETNTTTPDLQSPSYESSATTVKNEDSSSPARSAAESAWDGGSTMENSVELRNDVESSAQKEKAVDSSRKGSASEDTKSLRDAPPPPVNFWTKRIEANKLKPVQNASVARPQINTSTPISNGIPAGSAALPSSNDTSSNHNRGSENQPPSRDIALPRGNKTRGGGPNRQRFSEPNSAKSAPPPPSGDTFAWPTVSAPDIDRRKEQGRNDKADQERATSSTTGTQGRPRFDQKMDLTPSVVFETRLPEGGRGLRSHVKGSTSDAVIRRPKQQPIVAGAATERPSTDDKSAAVPPRPLSTNAKAQVNSTVTEVVAESQNGSATSNWRQFAQREAGDIKERDTDDPPPRQNAKLQDKPLFTDLGDTVGGSDTKDEASSTPLVDAVSKDNAWDPATNSQNSAHFARPDPTNRRKNAQTDVPRGSLETTSKRGKKSPIEARSRAHSQGIESYPYATPRTSRGPMRGRGGRGRGEYAGLQHQSHFGQSNLPMLQTNSVSTSKGSPPYTSPFTAPPGYERRGHRGSSQRANIPNDSFLGRHAPNYPANSPYGMYSSPMYEYGMAPMSAYPYSPHIEQYLVYQAVAQQLSYYFSLENILKDMFLRQHMDSQGFVPLSLIASFKRIKDLTPDYELVKSVCIQSSEVELRTLPEGQAKVRRRNDWKEWVLPMDKRHESAQNDGPPEQAQQPSQPQSAIKSSLPSANGYPSVTNGSSDSNQAETSGSALRPSAPQWTDMQPSDTQRGRQAASAVDANQASLGSVQSGTTSGSKVSAHVEDDFQDSQIPTLMLAVKKINNQQPPQPRHLSASTRTFSNGSLEDGVPTDGVQRPRSALGSREGEAERSFRAAKSPSRPAKALPEVFWLKGNDIKATELPSNGDSEPYFHVHAQAMEARRKAGSGECPYELQVLYQFWAHFLIRNFNTTMYDEFRQLAREDIGRGYSDLGMKHLLAYYNEALVNQRNIRDRVARHYVQLVTEEDAAKPSRPAFEQMRKAWLNGALNFRNRKRVADRMSDDLKAELDRRTTLSTST